jgi:hypothetical protein
VFLGGDDDDGDGERKGRLEGRNLGVYMLFSFLGHVSRMRYFLAAAPGRGIGLTLNVRSFTLLFSGRVARHVYPAGGRGLLARYDWS